MRSRITITISEDLLAQVDKTIDNHTLRNRSQAIESLLRQVLQPSVSTAVILAGGSLGVDPVSNQPLPKPLIPIKDEPVIHHILNHLKRYGITKVIICTSPDSHDQIQSFIGNGSLYNLQVEYSSETKKLGTGGALKHAKELIPDGPFLMMHGDVLTDIDLSELMSFFSNGDKLAVLATKPRPGRLSYGRVFLEGNTVINFKVPEETSPVSLVNTGIYLFDHQVLEYLPESEEVFSIEETLIPTLVKKGLVAGSVFQGIWFDVSESESYSEANERWQV